MGFSAVQSATEHGFASGYAAQSVALDDDAIRLVIRCTVAAAAIDTQLNEFESY